MPTSRIDLEQEVFAHEGETAFGAVREIHPDHLIVWIENCGDRRIDARHITSVHDDKVIVDVEALPEEMRAAIAQAHERERDG